MSDLPDYFQSREDYEEWLDPIVEDQVDEFLDYFDEDEITKEVIDDWCRDAPFIANEDAELARIYDDVREYSDRAQLSEYRHTFPVVDWLNDPHGCMSTLVTEWIALDVADRMQIEIESRGVPTGPPREEIDT